MQRTLAIAVLVILAGTPISRVVCGWECAQGSDVASSEECHDQNGAETAFNIGVDHCEGSGLPVALTAKPSVGLTASSLASTSAQPAPVAQLNRWAVSPFGDSATAPPANRLIPLRI
jgi:hypothetical protein